MGKTWKRIPGSYDEDGNPNYVRHGRQPEVITAEWAAKRLSRRLDCWIREKVAQGVLSEYDRENALYSFDKTVRRAVALYDPARLGPEGLPVSATTYLRTAFENAAQNIVRDLGRQCRTAVLVSIVDGRAREGEQTISSEDPVFSDQCAAVRTLWLMMDVAAFMRCLSPAERVFVRMQYEGHTLEETASALGMTRRSLCRIVVRRVRLVARICGFFSREDVRAGRDREELYVKKACGASVWAHRGRRLK